jgi:hypothetical protein
LEQNAKEDEGEMGDDEDDPYESETKGDEGDTYDD